MQLTWIFITFSTMTSLCRHLSAQEIVNWVTTADRCVHTADATQLDSSVASAVCIGLKGLSRCWPHHDFSRQRYRQSRFCSTSVVREHATFTVQGRSADAASCTRHQRVDCYSTVLAWISGSLLDRLQTVMNAAAQMLFSAIRSEHWFKVQKRINFRICNSPRSYNWLPTWVHIVIFGLRQR